MPAQATSTQPQPSFAPDLDLYRDRDDFMREFNPQSAQQRRLLTFAWRAGRHLLKMYEVQDYLYQTIELDALLDTQFEKYRIVVRQVAEAERMWRNSLEVFFKLQRAEQRPEKPPAPLLRRAAILQPVAHPPVPEITPAPEPAQPAAASQPPS